VTSVASSFRSWYGDHMSYGDVVEQEPDAATVVFLTDLLRFVGPPKPLKQVQRETRALIQRCRLVRREVTAWRKRVVSTTVQTVDDRLRPFALALGRLLASDVLRHTKAGSS
jgi:hypothetical protein